MKIVDKKQSPNTSLLPTIWIGSPDSPVRTSVEGEGSVARHNASRGVNESKAQLHPGEVAIRKSA